MAIKPLTLSIIILAYNEESHICDCLDAIARQTVQPDEVILVDNNCTDNTVSLARQYPFVTVVTERQQGMTYARNKGFDSAKSDIVARIDADTRLDSDWVEKLIAEYQSTGADAIGGVAYGPVLPEILKKQSTFWPMSYLYTARWIFNTPILWGPNYSLKRSVWQEVRGDVCMDGLAVHEDQDLSLVIASKGKQIVISPRLKVTIDVVVTRYGEYMRRLVRTYTLHRRLGNLATIRPHYNPLRRALVGLFVISPLLFACNLMILSGCCGYYAKKLFNRSWRSQPDLG